MSSTNFSLNNRNAFEIEKRRSVRREIKRRGLDDSPTTAGLREDAVPLSFAQQRLWFIDRLEGASTEYNMFRPVRLRGVLDVERWSGRSTRS